jgi:hypothetical protein
MKSAKIHPTDPTDQLESLYQKSQNVAIDNEDLFSDVSSEFSDGEEKKLDSDRKENKGNSKKQEQQQLSHISSKFKAKFGGNKEEIRAKIMTEVVEKILPDIGTYNEDGYVPPAKEKKTSNHYRNFINTLKLFGLLSLDLHEAVLTGSENQVKKSISKLYHPKNPHPEYINQYNAQGVTPLSLAVKINNLQFVSLLLENNASCDYVDENTGRTPIFYSILNGNHRMTEMLLACKANVNMVDFQCISPLMVAVSKNDEIHCKLLCAANADVDLQDDQGWTALHHAAANNAFQCIAILVAEGANKRFKDLNNRKAIHIAKYKNYGNCIAMLSNKSSLA